MNELAREAGHARVAVNFTWLLMTASLVLFMQAGFALLTVGLTRAKNAGHMFMLNFAAFVIALIGYYAVGFAFHFVDGQVVGYISCFPLDGGDHVGYWIDRAHWGRGVASRALEKLLREVAQRPLVAVAATGNGASIRVLQKCGFVIEEVRQSPASERYPACEEAVFMLR